MSLEDVFASYTDKIAPRITRAHLGFTLKTPANDHGDLCSCLPCEWTPARDMKCRFCERTACSCDEAGSK